VSTPLWRSSPSAISDGRGYLSAEGRGVFTGSFVSGMRVLFSYVLILLSRDSMWVKGKERIVEGNVEGYVGFRSE